MTPSTPPKTRKRAPTPATHPLTLWQDTHKQEEVRIEIIPLIDVIFCILTFFILAAVGVSRQQAISLNLPKASTGSAQMQDMLIISLDDFGQVYVEQSPVSTRNQLSQAVSNYMRTSPNGLMVLYASKEARYDEVIQVLDILREVGGDRIALATLPGGQDSPDLEPNPLDPGQLAPLEPNPLDPGLDPLAPYGMPAFPDIETPNELETPNDLETPGGTDLPLDP